MWLFFKSFFLEKQRSVYFFTVIVLVQSNLTIIVDQNCDLGCLVFQNTVIYTIIIFNDSHKFNEQYANVVIIIAAEQCLSTLQNVIMSMQKEPQAYIYIKVFPRVWIFFF